MKYEVRFTTQFKKDLKLAKKQGKDTEKLFAVIEKLANGSTIEHAAFNSGFNDSKYFSRVIKKFFNCTPRELKSFGK